MCVKVTQALGMIFERLVVMEVQLYWEIERNN